MFQTKVNSILNISNREINRDAVTCLVGLLKGQSSPPERKAEFLIANIVSKDQVQFVIEKECEFSLAKSTMRKRSKFKNRLSFKFQCVT